MLLLLGWSMSVNAQCPAVPTTPTTTPKVCINSIPGTYDLSQEGTGAAAGVTGWRFFSALQVNGTPQNPVTTNQVSPGTYYAAYVDAGGNLCFGNNNVAVLEVASKPAPPFATMTVCASNLPTGLAATLGGGVFDLTTIPGIDKWYLDPALLNAITNAMPVPPGTYYGTVDANNTANGCESEVAVFTVEPAPYPPIIVAPVGTMCVNPVTGTFDLNDIVLSSNVLDPNYPFTIPIPSSRYKFWQDTAGTGGLLVALTGAVVPAGTYMVSHTTFACESMPLEFTIEPREVAPVLSANDACVDVVTGTFDLCLVTSTDPVDEALTWYPTLADVQNGTNVIGTCSGGAPLVVTPGTYYATYQGDDCESAPTAFVVKETPAALTGYNCDLTPGNNPGGGGNCIGPDGEETIRLFSCTDDVFTVAGVEAEIKMNANYGVGLNVAIIPNTGLNYYASYADAVAQTPTTSLSDTLSNFLPYAAANAPKTSFLWVTQTDPNTGCESAPARLRLRMRLRPEVRTVNPASVCLGEVVNLFSTAPYYMLDDRNRAETWNIYDTDPTAGPATLLASSPANLVGPNRGEPDGSVDYNVNYATPGTYTFWVEAINEEGTYDADCNDVGGPITITVLPKPVITASVLPNDTVCSNSSATIVFLDANGDPTPSATVNDLDVSAVVDGGLTVVSGPTTGNGLAIGSIAGDQFRNFQNTPLNVTYTISPNGPLPQNCPGDTIVVVVTILPEPIMPAGLSDTTCSNVASNLALSTTNGVTATFYWADPSMTGNLSKYPNHAVDYSRAAPGTADPITDAYLNQSLTDGTATYTITPVSADGCVGDAVTAEVVVNPEPVITAPLGDTLCSGGTTNIALSVSLPTNIDAVAYRWDAPASYPTGVTGPATGSNGAQPGTFVYVPVPVPGQIFVQETFTNMTSGDVTIKLPLWALGDPVNAHSGSPQGCESIPDTMYIVVHPEPVFSSNWPTLICSNDPTVNVDLVAPTIVNAIPGTGAWYRNVGGTWVLVSGVQTISHGDQFEYRWTGATAPNCMYTHSETVNLQEAPTMTPVPNPPLCADNVNLAAKTIDLDDYEPTVTNSVGGSMAGSGEWHDIMGNVVAPTTNNFVRNGDTYCYVFTASNGCADSVCYTFIVNEIPNAVLTGGGTICPPATATNDVVASFTSTGPWTFYYSIDGVAQAPVTTGLATYTLAGSGSVTGTYRVDSIVNGNGCSTMAGYTSNTVAVAPANTIAAICRNITEQLDGNGFAAITGADIDENSGYGCNSNITLTRLAYPAIFDCDDLGPNSVTLKVFDANTAAPHDTAYCVSIVTVEDNVNPSIVCAIVNNPYSTDAGVCYWEVPDDQLDPPVTSDNCTVVSVEHNYGPAPLSTTLENAQFPKGTTTVVWTVTDQSGNTDVCAYNITVEDNEAPVITTCPPSRQIYTSDDGGNDCESDIPNLLPELVFSDNCSATASQSPVAGSNVAGSHLDQTVVTFTVDDGSAASANATCTATLTLIDDQAPVISCPGPVTVQCDDPTGIAATGNASATDNCAASPSITHSDLAVLSGCNGTGTIVRTFTADDNNVDPLTGNSNTSSCQQVITVVDTEAPVVTGFSDPTEYCDFSEIPRFTFSGFIAAGGTVSDNCGYDTTTFKFLSQNIVGNCGATVTEEYEIKDNCGNPATATVTFIVDDNVTPTWNNTPAIADVTINCEDDNSSASTGVPAWTDNCYSTIAESDSYSGYSSDPNDCGHYTYSIDRTFTVTDICGNNISHTQTINVQDVTDPVITCSRTSYTVDTDTDVCYATIGSGILTASATDNCATNNLSYRYEIWQSGSMIGSGTGSDAAGQYDKGTYTVRIYAEDPCTNDAFCDITVTVEDNQNPAVACVGTLNVYLDDQGNATIDVSDIVTSDSDNCPGHTVSLDKTSFDCSEVTAVIGNTITVTATAVDASGNSSSCTTVVTVIDNLPPDPDCQDVTVYLNGTCNASITAADVAGNASDNCAIVSTTASPLTFDGSDLTILGGNNPNPPVDVTVTYVDPSGNSISCVAKVTVKDTIPPSVTCISPAPVNNTPGLCEAPVVPAVPSLGDNCQVTTLTNDYTGLPSAAATYPVGTTQVTWTVFDFAGNSTDCVIDVVVIDNEAPTAACKDITVQLDATGNASITAADLDNGSDDNCPGYALTLNDYDFDCGDIQGPFNTNNVVAVTLTITDGAGLTNDAACNVTVRDEVNPDAQCQNAVVQLDANGNGSITTADIDNGSNDACGIFSLTLSQTAFDCSNVGNNAVTLTVIDNNGNISICNANVDVQDNIDPIAICQDTIVQLDVNGNGVLTPAMVDNGSNDACGIASMTVSPNAFTCADVNANITVTLTVTDVNGNVATCTSNVLIKDEVSPTAQCRDLTVQLDANGDASITVADVDNGTFDNCTNPPFMSLDKTSFGCGDVGTNSVTLTAVDAQGNSATCIAIITIEDNIDPDVVCMNAIVELDSTGNGSITVADIDNGSSDACGIASMVLSNTAYTCADLGTNGVTLTVTDVNGNVASCNADVDVQDNIDPNVDAADVTVCNDAGVCEAAVSLVATAWDNCTIVTETWAGTVNPFYGTPYAISGTGLDASGTYPVGSATVTFTVIDQSGNSDQVTVTVTVNDCEAPVITQAENLCGGSVTLPNVTGDCYQQFAWTTPTAADNCNVASFTRALSDPSVQPMMIAGTTLGLFPVGTTTVTYTAVDDYGNTTVCEFDVIVEDTEDPQILNCPTAPITVNTDPGNCSAQVVLPNNITAIDNCPIVSMSDDVLAGSVFPTGTTTVTFTATDNSGRTSTCVFDVVVLDTEAPEITCPANIVADNDPGECGAVINYATPGWDDNCTGFRDVFDPANMSINANVNGVGDGAVDVSNAPDFIVMTGSDNATGPDSGRVAFTAPTNGTLTFTFAYSTIDIYAFWDQFGYSLNGVYTDLVDDFDASAGGTVSFNLSAGDVFAWVISTPDGEFGRSTAVIGDVSFGYTLQQIAGLGSGGNFPVGTTTERWVITDPAGNADTCSFDITVNDTEDPTINSSAVVVSNFDDNTGGPLGNVNSTFGNYQFFIPVTQAITIDDVDVTITGTHTWSGDLDFYLQSPAGTIVHLRDHSTGNDTPDFDFTFDDEAAQQFNNGTTVSPIGGGLSWRPNGDGENTNGSAGSNPTTMSAFDGENALGPWTLHIGDRNGGDFGSLTSWSLTFTTADPSLQGPVTVTIPADAGQCGAMYSFASLVVDDNCPGATLAQTSGLTSGSMFPVGTTTQSYVATDAAGNSTTYSFDITVEDTEDPTISCPASATIGNDPGDCDATLAYTINFNDNCPGAVLTQTAGLGNGGSVAVGASSTESYTVTDGAGNTASCSFTITVEDQEAPQISGCPANIGPVNNDPGVCGAVVTWNTNNLVSSDNCPGETLASNYQSGDVIPVGMNTITYTVTDAVGLTASCDFTIEVLDVEDPVITCPANVIVTQQLALIPNCGANITGFIATATDNCSATISNDTYPAGGADASGFYPIGTTTVTFTATDPAGNNVSCTADVTVDAVAPTASVNNGNPMDLCSDNATITASGNDPGVGFSGQWTVSPSTGVVIANAASYNSSITFPGAGTYTVTWTVTSDCTGATASASFTVNVYDPPVLDFSCSTDPTLVGGSDGVACVTATGGSGNFSYQWDAAAGNATTSSVSGLPAGTYSVVVTDNTSGCTSSGSVTLVDPPVTRICELKDYDLAGFGVWFRLAPGSIPGNGNYTWVGGYGTYKEYASGEVQITGSIQDKVDATKVWDVDIWLIGKQFWGAWGATNGWAGTAANVGTNYTSWTYYTLNGSKSTMTGQGFFAGDAITLSHRSYAANGGNGGFQVGQAANNQNALYGMYGQFDYTGSYSGWGEISGRFDNCIGTQQIGPIAVLQGAYDGTSGMMRDDLRAASLVPTTEPYTGLGYTHVGGGGSETVAQSVLNTTGLNAIIDWVVVELRESANPSNVIASRSALMQADGDIVDVDGISTVEFNAVADGDYYVAVLHRNHVGIMTGNALTLVSNAPAATTVDFTTTSLYGGPTAYATVGAGFQALVAGDASFDGQVQNTDDVYFWAPSTGSSGYQAGDYNLDAQVQNTDKVYYWISNAGLGTAIPQ